MEIVLAFAGAIFLIIRGYTLYDAPHMLRRGTMLYNWILSRRNLSYKLRDVNRTKPLSDDDIKSYGLMYMRTGTVTLVLCILILIFL